MRDMDIHEGYLVGLVAAFLFAGLASAGTVADTVLIATVNDTTVPVITWGAWAGLNATTTTNTTNVTLTTNKKVVWCNLTVNGTNYSMSGISYSTWWQNLTHLTNGNYTIWANCTDADGRQANSTIVWWNVHYTVAPPDGGGGGGGGPPSIPTNGTNQTGRIIPETNIFVSNFEWWWIILILFFFWLIYRDSKKSNSATQKSWKIISKREYGY